MKGRTAKKGGGSTGGVDMAEADEKDKPRDHTADDEGTGKEAEERKSGGRAKRKHGGAMKVEGEKAKMHAGRKPRKAGGRTGSNFSPLSSAHSGKPAPGRKEMSESMD
jgi:hypothetical protein